MTTPEEIYDRYIIKSEKNGLNDNTSTDKGRFIELYNELAPRVIKWYLNNRNRDDLTDIQVLLVDDLKLKPEKKHLDHVDFNLPKDFLSWSYVSAIASNENCSNQQLYLYEIKDEDRAHVMSNRFLQPSFDYREAPYLYASNFIKVFTEKGMDIDKLILSYYRYPNKLTLTDPDNPESNFSSTEVELPDEVLNRVISAMVGDFKMNNSDPSYQVDKLRQNENLK